MQQPNDQGGERSGEESFRDPNGGADRRQTLPPPQAQPPPSRPPKSGFRIQLDHSDVEFPPSSQTGPPVCLDTDGESPVYIGTATLHDVSLHPCKICPSSNPPCRIPYGGDEIEHHGKYDLLPITPDMEWVPTRNGEIPPGRRPVQGGYESNGEKLYHAVGKINGMDVPGKTGRHLVSGSLLSIHVGFPRDSNLGRVLQTYLLVLTNTSSTNTTFCKQRSTRCLSTYLTQTHYEPGAGGKHTKRMKRV